MTRAFKVCPRVKIERERARVCEREREGEGERVCVCERDSETETAGEKARESAIDLGLHRYRACPVSSWPLCKRCLASADRENHV